jgi:hypothetical protein
MKTVWTISGVLALGLALGGCSSSGLLRSMGLGDAPAPAAPVVRTGNNLALPPDLQLRPPGTVTEDYQPNTVPAAPVKTASVDEGLYSSAPAAAPPAKQDIYAEYGVSKLKPDGTPKAKADLQAELKKAIIKRKRETQPGYGTIFNMGNIFSDG